MKRFLSFALCLLAISSLWAQKTFTLASPDGRIQSTIQVGETITYDITVDGQQVLAPSALSMTLTNGTEWGVKPRLAGSKTLSVNEEILSPFTRQASMLNRCNQLTLSFKDNYSVEFRAYDNGVAYRFVNGNKKPFEVKNETVEYRLTGDQECIVPYVRNFDADKPEKQFFNSFENTYTTAPISKLDNRRYCFLPLIASAGESIKLCFTETHLESYPGLYLQADGQRFRSVFAPFPKDVKQGGHNNLQMLVQSRYDYIARVVGPRTFPWRIAMISRQDKELAENNLSYLLAAPNRVKDISWIRPGKVAWDWWNDWNLGNVPFKAGINNETYKHYIDFAAEKGIEYVILDEGWAVNLEADLFQVVPAINLQELVDYGRERNVGIILWAGYWAFDRDMERVCQHYSAMGVKGFKVDFMDRDDQLITNFYYRAAEMAAKYQLMLDFHGAFKPAGLNRTYPNVLNFEGVNGLEQLKWSDRDYDQILYDAQIPFIRQAAGPMDYTQGAMLNAAKGHYYPCYSEPMSQGTRCHQLGLYMILDSPFSMLCDSPTNYLNLGGPCTDFIAQVPTVWDDTRVISGEIGKYIVTARRKADAWYIGGINNWEARDIEIPTDFLGSDRYQTEFFLDGVNAHRRGSDYQHIQSLQSFSEPIRVHMAPGGGFAIVLAR